MLEARFREVTDKIEEFAATITDLKAGIMDDHSEEIRTLETRLKELKSKNLENEKKIFEPTSSKEQTSDEHNDLDEPENPARERHVSSSKSQQKVSRYPEPWDSRSNPYYRYEKYHDQEYYPAHHLHPGKVKPAWVRKH